LASATLFFSQITVLTVSYYIGLGVGKWSILISYGIYLSSFALCICVAGRRMMPRRTGIVALFSLFATIVFISSLFTLIFNPSTALIRNVSYALTFGVVPFLIGSAQDKRTLEVLLSIIFYAGTLVALITIAPTSWAYDPSYGRPIFLGADFLRLLLGSLLAITTLTGFYYAVTAQGKTLCAVTLACSALCFVSLYFNVMRMAYYLASLLLILMPLHLLVLKRISIWRSFAFVGVAIGMHLFCKKVFFFIGLASSLLSALSGSSLDGWTPDTYYDMLSRSHVQDLDWQAIFERFSKNSLPLTQGLSAIGLNGMFDLYPNDSTVIRVRLYLEAMMMFFALPLTGVGASMFQQFSFQGPFSFPHSSLLHVAAELGVAGLLVFVVLIAVCAWRLLPHALLLSPFLFFIAIDQTHGSYFTSWGSYFFMGVAASLARVDRGHSLRIDTRHFQLLIPTRKT